MYNPNPSLHRCRNPRCKSWLKEPVSNPRNAFCCVACESGFYRTHCRVCERPIVGKNSRRQLCGRHRCEHEFQRNRQGFFSVWYPNATLAVKPEKNPANSTPKTTIKSDRGAVFAIGADYDREVLRANVRANARFWDDAALIGPTDLPVNIHDIASFRRFFLCRGSA